MIGGWLNLPVARLRKRWFLSFKNLIGTRRLYYHPKRSFGQGNIFTSVCQEFCSQGVQHALQVSPWGGVSQHALQVSPGGVSIFLGGSGPGGLQFFLGGLVPGRGSPIFRGVSNFSGRSPIFWGSPIFLGVSNFGGIKGDPPFFGGYFFDFCLSLGIHPPRTRHRNTVNVRPVRILLECILVE